MPLTRPTSRSLSSGAHSRDPVASPGDLSPRKERGEVKKKPQPSEDDVLGAEAG